MQKKRGDFSVLTEKKRVKRVPDTVTETEREREEEGSRSMKGMKG